MRRPWDKEPMTPDELAERDARGVIGWVIFALAVMFIAVGWATWRFLLSGWVSF